MNVEKKTYQKITPAIPENYLTTYKDSDDISTYEAVKVMYTPSEFDISTIREISQEEHYLLLSKKETTLQHQIKE